MSDKKRLERMTFALTKAAEQFEFYATEHRKKDPPQHAKAATNESFAALCRGALLP